MKNTIFTSIPKQIMIDFFKDRYKIQEIDFQKIIKNKGNYVVAEILEKIIETSGSSAQKLNVKSALNPGLWLCAIVSPICFTAAYFFREEKILLYMVSIVGILPILAVCIIFIYYAIKKPEKLQSEEFQIRLDTLQMIMQKGKGKIEITPEILSVATYNHKLVEKKEKGE